MPVIGRRPLMVTDDFDDAVGRCPAPGDEAWTAAGQLKALAPNLELSRWEVAVALSAGDAWFVHNRP